MNDPGSVLRVTTWNVEWARPGTPKGERISSVLSQQAGVVVLTESEPGLLGGGSTIEGGSEWGYPVQRPARRKVLAFSPGEWTAVDPVGSADLPPGRFVAGTTETAVGPIRVVGVCIPWHMAHVSGGRRDRRPWEDHRKYLEHLRRVLAEQPRPLVVAGDFNQRVPRVRQPGWAAELLAEAFDGLEIITAGTEHGPLIDHVAISGDLVAQRVQVLPAEDAEGRLSDHLGVTVELTAGR